ncbi:DUF302 domain-containing protein [Vibrio superstes]|uniref:DUF302 domain-containing protein n=1 Tax=Vibrio superstes NBRC 103154 TaxID=1219062 RepID=A0A511QXR2_9VIBR|nr:DUF302 domain-containing protein [Vibrio superstes]GEM81516.1 hypothetical protein VSU01S_37610 [Vibrio superstes NBRC 103154]
MKNSLVMMLSPIVLMACSHGPMESTPQDIAAVDTRTELVTKKAEQLQLEPVLSIDHSRLGADAGEDLSASRVSLFSDDKLNAQLLQQNVESGLDLPFRVLNYAEDGVVKTRYTSAEFLARRHGITNKPSLTAFDQTVKQLVEDIPNATPASTAGLTQGYGISRIVSDYDFETTIENIKTSVLSQEGTIWFLTLDFAKRAQVQGGTLPKATLLVFGAPGPGAKAMNEHLSIGLDTFGQKVLVYQTGEQVTVAYNDIVEMARLHYDDSAIAHRVVNGMLGKTVSKAVEK